MYEILYPLHSFLPYLLLGVLLIAIVIFIVKRAGSKPFLRTDRGLALIVLILTHLQFLIGLFLFFVSPKVQGALDSGEIMSNDAFRFSVVEHPVTMLIAAILITVGYSRAKKITESANKFNRLIIFYILGLIFMLAMIPWDIWPK